MPTVPPGPDLRPLRRALQGYAADGHSDEELLQRFLAAPDEAAFTALVRRHGPLVLGVCRRVLRHRQDAEDAFQATFLVLVRRARALRQPARLGNWLYGVAYRVAQAARRRAARRDVRERQAARLSPIEPAPESAAQEVQALLDEELAHLPQPERALLVQCDLEGRTHEGTARALGIPPGSMSRRLARAREMLRQRLVRRGVALSAAALAAALGEGKSAAVAAPLVAATVKAGLLAAAGRAASAVSGEVLTLAEGVHRAMSTTRTVLLAFVLVLGALGLGAGLLVPAALTPPGAEARAEPARPAGEANPGKKPAPRLDRHGDPLPEGAVARLGTTRFRHGFNFQRVSFSPDGKVLASTGDGRALCLWEVETGRLLHHFQAAQSSIPSAYAVAFFPDGKKIAFCGISTLSVRDLATGKELYQFKSEGGVISLAVSPDGTRLAHTANRDIKLCDARSGKVLQTLKGHETFIHPLAFAPDGKTLASGEFNGTIVLWDVAAGAERLRWEGHPWDGRTGGGAQALAFSPDGTLLASCSQDRTVRLWEVATGKQKRVVRSEALSVYSVAFAPDGKTLAFHDGPSICLQDVATGKEARRWRASGTAVAALAFAPDGKLLASGGVWESAARLWDPATGKEVRSTSGHTGIVDILQFAADGRTLRSFARDQQLLHWDLSSGRAEGRLMEGMPGFLQNTVLSLDGKLLVRGLWRDMSVCLWDTATGKELRLLGKHKGWVRGVAISPNNQLVASAGEEGAVVVRETATGKERHRFANFKGVDRTYVPLVFTPDGQTLAAGCHDEKVRLWDLGTGKEHQIEVPLKPTSLAFSPDGRRLAVAERYREKPVLIYDTAGGKLLRACEGQFTGAYGLAFSPDGRLLATGGSESDSKVRLWEVATGRPVHLFDGYPRGVGVMALAFAPDGRTLASGGGDSGILLWDLTGGARPAQLSGARLKSLWEALADPDPARAYPALWQLVAAPADALPLLRKQLPPARVVEEKQLARFVASLESKSFREREEAVRQLERLGFGAEPSLRKILEGNLTLEGRRRVEQLLDRIIRSGEWLRALRALQALEYAGTAGARQLLRELAGGASGAQLTREAQAALGRLTQPARAQKGEKR